MKDVRMPDGTIVKNVPDNVGQAELIRRLGKTGGEKTVAIPSPPPTPALDVAAETGAIKFIDNILGLPQAAGELLATGAGAIEAMGPKTLDEAIEGQRKQFPASALGAIPRIRVEDIIPEAGRRAERFQQESPGAVAAGKISGDIFTMVSGRVPFAKRLAATKKPPTPLNLPPGKRRLLDKAIKSPKTTKLFRGAGRSLEAGFEGAVLGVLSEGDPVELAAFGVGTQMANSIILETGKGLFSGGVLKAGTKIGAAAFAVGSAIQLLKTVTPGGKDFILQSMEAGFDKMAAALILGVGSALLGGGRVRASKFAEDLPFVSDAITAIPRNGLLATIKEYGQVTELEQSDIENVVMKLVTNPGFFDENTRRKIDRAIREEDVSLSGTISRLKRDNPSFRNKLKKLGR